MKYTISMKVDGRIDVEVEAETPEEAFKKADEAFMDLESAAFADMHIVDYSPVNCTDPDGKVTDPKVVPPPAGHDSWYDWQSLTDADHHEVAVDSARRHWGYPLANLRKEIANFQKAMAKGDLHATSMICARLEDCNYHEVCGKLAEGDMAAAAKAAEAIYAAD